MSNNYTKEVLEILEKLGNKDLNLCLPFKVATQVLAKISKMEELKTGAVKKTQAKILQICPELALVQNLTRNEIVNRRKNLKEDDVFKVLALDLAMAYCDLKDLKLQNQSLPDDKRIEMRAKEIEMEATLTEQLNQLSTKVAMSDPELLEASINSQEVDFGQLEQSMKEIGELLAVGEKILDLTFDEQKTLFHTLKVLNSFR